MQFDFDYHNPPQMPTLPKQTWAERHPVEAFMLCMVGMSIILVGVGIVIALLFSP